MGVSTKSPAVSEQAKRDEQSLHQRDLHRKYKNKCEVGNLDCCKWALELQPDFTQQKPLVQETIKVAEHLCLFFPEFHCELNYIEFFWAEVKKYLCDHCNYTFDTLKDNITKALESVPLVTIQQWGHQMYRWMKAYHSSLGTSATQLQVKKFGSV